MDTATIITLVIAILSATISTVTAFIPTWLNHLYSKWIAAAKSNADFNMHKEPVLVAAIHLAYELYYFLDGDGKTWLDDKDNGELFYHSAAYLCYRFAIFFARLEALKNDVQLLNLGRSDADLVKLLCQMELILFQKRGGAKEHEYVIVRRDDIEAMIEAVGPMSNPNGSKSEDKTQGTDLMGYATFSSLLQIDNVPFQGEGDTDHEGLSHRMPTKIENTKNVTSFQQEPDTNHKEPRRYTLAMTENVEDTDGDGTSPPAEPAAYFKPQAPRVEKTSPRPNLTSESKELDQPNIYRNYRKWFNPLMDKLKEISRDSRKEISQDDRTKASQPKSADNCSKTSQSHGLCDFRLRKLHHRLIDLIKMLDPDGRRIDVKAGVVDDFRPVRPSQNDPKRCGCRYACEIEKKISQRVNQSV